MFFEETSLDLSQTNLGLKWKSFGIEETNILRFRKMKMELKKPTS